MNGALIKMLLLNLPFFEAIQRIVNKSIICPFMADNALYLSALASGAREFCTPHKNTCYTGAETKVIQKNHLLARPNIV
ncbi:MAG: hypothetical protein ACRDBM_18005 [Sporomusa sp.]